MNGVLLSSYRLHEVKVTRYVSIVTITVLSHTFITLLFIVHLSDSAVIVVKVRTYCIQSG